MPACHACGVVNEQTCGVAMPSTSATSQFQYFGVILLPADGTHATVARGDFGTSRWQLSDEITLVPGA
jgi:hypothetical protein